MEKLGSRRSESNNYWRNIKSSQIFLSWEKSKHILISEQNSSSNSNWYPKKKGDPGLWHSHHTLSLLLRITLTNKVTTLNGWKLVGARRYRNRPSQVVIRETCHRWYSTVLYSPQASHHHPCRIKGKSCCGDGENRYLNRVYTCIYSLTEVQLYVSFTESRQRLKLPFTFPKSTTGETSIGYGCLDRMQVALHMQVPVRWGWSIITAARWELGSASLKSARRYWSDKRDTGSGIYFTFTGDTRANPNLTAYDGS